MKKALGIGCALALAASTAAAASPQLVAPYLHPARTIVTHVYRCWAYAPNGAYGYSAWVTSLALAHQEALYQCAIRTPRGLICVITRCQ
ncbi:MAG TPA: hypothetical protein VKT30_06040 [Caulobacteraceae bacterium]|nr:hypothetical protein [Caulobacteraceae bacterium]